MGELRSLGSGSMTIAASDTITSGTTSHRLPGTACHLWLAPLIVPHRPLTCPPLITLHDWSLSPQFLEELWRGTG
jgi:hypothetical protein